MNATLCIECGLTLVNHSMSSMDHEFTVAKPKKRPERITGHGSRTGRRGPRDEPTVCRYCGFPIVRHKNLGHEFEPLPERAVSHRDLGVTRDTLRNPPKPRRATVHYLKKNARRVAKKTAGAGEFKVVGGGALVFKATTFGACWSHLREMVEAGEVPYSSCAEALGHEYSIHPDPQADRSVNDEVHV